MNLHLITARSHLSARPQSARLRAITTVFCLCCAAGVSTAEAGAIYKSIDSNGNVIFTDRPSEGAEALNVEAAKKKRKREVTDEPAPTDEVVENPEKNSATEVEHELPSPEALVAAPEPKNPPKQKPQEPNQPAKALPVTNIEILTPIHEATLHDPIGKIWVELQSYPTPLKKTGLTAQLWMNNKLIASGQRTMLGLPPPTRGTHELQVKLVDDKGRLFLQSDISKIHVKYKVSSQ